MAVGIYIAVPFCRAKCSFCNFASGPAPRAVHDVYLARLAEELAAAGGFAEKHGCCFDSVADSVYLGGGTPSILEPAQMRQLFAALRLNFTVAKDAEITVECAPGTLSPEVVEALAACGVTRASLGVQSFVEKESRAVGRLHTPAMIAEEMARLRAAGIAEVNLDLIAGLPWQNAASWGESLRRTVESGANHVSVYMFEIDEDSRLGAEVLRGGSRYGAARLPDEDETADLYLQAVEALEAAGLERYEISNFARRGHRSRHNLKYWQREPYLGFGVDAHSMLPLDGKPCEALRWAQPDELDAYLQKQPAALTAVGAAAALEERFFLGLRLREGLELTAVAREFGAAAVARFAPAIRALVAEKLLLREGSRIRLSGRGVLLSNEVFVRFLGGGPEERR
jgi:oxygen-independent coproporphyrinogen-3 oxidase